MTSPAEGVVCGTTRRTRTSPSAARSRMRSSSLAPATVRLATTRISVIGAHLRTSRGRPRAAACAGGGGGRGSEDAVYGAGHAVLVGAADDRRHAVGVEDRGRRSALPLERHATPWVGQRARAAAPAGDDVVEEQQ